MRQGSPAAASPLTWVVAVFLLLGIDASITRTPLLWAPTSFENPIREPFFLGQTYRIARAIYATPHEPAIRIALIGNSRLFLATRGESVERDLAAAAPDLRTHVDRMGVFGMGPVITEMLIRQLARMDPDLVVLTINGSDLRMPVSEQMRNPAYRLLAIGWKDGVVSPAGWTPRLDRWLRTIWPLWRFREFSRAALLERAFPPAEIQLEPERFRTRRELLRYARGPKRTNAILTAWRHWEENPTLENFVAYLRLGHARHLTEIKRRAHALVVPSDIAQNLATVDAVLDFLARRQQPAVLLFMPENPLLDQDTAGRYHPLGGAEKETAELERIAVRHAVPVIDARHWMPARSFMDFDHLWLDLSGFENLLAKEILRVLRD